MNFFKSILADDPDPPEPENNHESVVNSSPAAPRGDGNTNNAADAWSFGDLFKTLTVQSESVIETYRRDLKEFGLGLRKESEIFRETASQAVKDLPASLEATATAAHGALDGVLKSTADIIAKESLLFPPDKEPETPETNRSVSFGRYSRFAAQLSAIQNDLNTFYEEPENVEEYGKWKSGFQLEDYKDEIEFLIGENETLESIHKRIVPTEVDHETFWCRYFYRLDKLKRQERVRANLVKRATLADEDDDELTWDVDDEEDGNGSDPKVKECNEVDNNVGSDHGNSKDLNVGGNGEKGVVVDSGKDDVSSGEKEDKSKEVADGEREVEVKSEEREEEVMFEEKKDEKVDVEEKGESGRGNEVSSHHPVGEEEEEMGWDEIGDTGSDDGKKTSGDKGDLRNRLSAMEDDEDLRWDIEDDDEPVKA